MHREIILGPPGTGKTTELIRRLEQAFEKGLEPERVAYLAFTKKAADVAISRATAHFGFGRQRFPYFRTIHSLAYHENGVSSDSVMRTSHYKELGLIHGWDFQASYEKMEERPNYGAGLGDQLLRCYDLAKAKGMSMMEEARADDYQFSQFAAQKFEQQIEAYKSRYGLQMFNDFLDTPVVLDVDLVIIDEAQDLTHLQWQFLRRSFKKTPTVLIAGDDDQCIYQWSGADLNYFLNLEAKNTVLGQSHRCDEEIWKVANRISQLIGRRYHKDWKPVRSGGKVLARRDPFDVDITKGEWMILVRKNKILSRYYKLCMNAGRIFHDGTMWVNEQRWFRAMLTYQALQRGDMINAWEATNLVRYCGYASKKVEQNDYFWEDFNWQLDRSTSWHAALDGLNYVQRKFIDSCIAKGEDLVKPGTLRLSTIHAAKGGEADNVMLDVRLDGIPLKQFKRDPDAERRVWYVGVSRARHQLVMTGGVKNEAINI